MGLKDVHALIPEISISRLSNWEQGINMVGVDEARKLAVVLKVPAAYLLTLEDAPMDETERQLLARFRSADIRGRNYILRAAQDEAQEEAVRPEPKPAPEVTTRTVKVGKNKTIYTGIERRGKKTEHE